jgi:phage repressor protein C with HTH and peptisase S24 domain
MYPILKSGDIVGFKGINNFGNVIYGEMYIVAFHLDGDQYLTVKYVNRSEKEGYVKLVSYNPHHEPMDLPVDTIQDMAIVKFSIRKNMMM